MQRASSRRNPLERGVQPSADDDGQGDEQMQESSGGSTEHISYLVHPRVDLEELPASSAA